VSGRSSAPRLPFHPAADVEAAKEAEYLREQDPRVALVFEVALAKALTSVHRFPHIGPVIWRQDGYEVRQKRLLHRLRYSLIYAIVNGEVRVVAVAHHSRLPGYWVERLATL
jgi:plasmid stabilization system protein ParE